MIKKDICRRVFYSVVCMWLLQGQAQDAENVRGRNWFTLQRLTALASLDSAFLSDADKKKLLALVMDRSPAAACTKPSSTPCNAGIGQPSGALKLTGVRISAANVKLDWQTLSELNSEGFVLERRSFVDSLQYDSIFYKKGQGTRYGKTRYGYIDQNSSSITSYYRVRETFLDGSFVYSNLVAVEGAVSKLAVLIAPNPATSSSAGFYVIGAAVSSVSFTVSNVAGNIFVKQEKVAVSGNTYISLSRYHLQHGFYFVSVFNDKEQISQKLIIY